MNYHVTSNPVIGTMILLVLLYLLFRINDLDITKIFVTNGLIEVYQQNPWIVCLAIAMIAYAGYSMYVGICSAKSKERFNTFSDQSEKQFMSFDRFYQTFVMIQNPLFLSQEIECKKNHSMNSEPQTVTPPNRFMIFRTDIDGIKYYLVMDSLLSQQLPYRVINKEVPKEYADQAAICKIDGTTTQYVTPTLIREDLLVAEYKQFVDNAFSTVSTAVNTQKALEIVKARNVSETNSESESNEHFGPLSESRSAILNASTPKPTRLDSGSILIGNSLTDAQETLQKTIYPRYIHHFYVSRVMNQDTIKPPPVFEPIGESAMNKSSHNHEIPKAKPSMHESLVPKNAELYYRVSGITRDQTVDVLNISNNAPYFLSATKSFTPGTLLRKRTMLESVKIPKPGTVEKVTKDIPIINDKKFICGVQFNGILPDTFYNIYAETITPQLDQIDSVLLDKNLQSTNVEEMQQKTYQRIDDSILFTGKNNTDIAHMEPMINLYFFGNSRDASGVLQSTKYWFAKMDSYNDPTNEINSSVVSNDPSTNPASPYFNKPKLFPVGMIPDNYKQCRTLGDGTIDTFCRGNTYTNGVDYSDARKINFEVATVQLNAF